VDNTRDYARVSHSRQWSNYRPNLCHKSNYKLTQFQYFLQTTVYGQTRAWGRGHYDVIAFNGSDWRS